MGKLTHGSLFSGIGGFDLAAEWAGWENKFHCEWNEFGKRVLNYYWPEVECYGDITKTDFRKWRGQIDVLTGGFPCQPYSVAGKRLGKEDERHLWPHMLRAIREIKPKYVVGENVRGLISWNGGLVFDEVQADLEAEGYTVIPCVLPACGVNAPHRRERVWFVAYRECGGRKTMCGVQHKESVGKMFSDNGERGTAPNTASKLQQGYEPGECGDERRENVQQEYRSTNTKQSGAMGEDGVASDTNNARNTASRSGIVGDWTENIIERELAQSEFDRYTDAANSASTGLERRIGRGSERERLTRDSPGYSEGDAANLYNARLERGEDNRSSGESREKRNEQFTGCFRPDWQNFPTQPPICGGDDGLSRELDGITFPKWRSESIKAYGNAIVPAVAFEIFKTINEIDNFLNENSYLL